MNGNDKDGNPNGFFICFPEVSRPSGRVSFAALAGTAAAVVPKSNSLIETTISGDLLLIHSKEDEVVPYSQSEKLYNSVLSKGGNAELVLLETGKHSPQDYAPAVVDALGWLKQYE